ncbi:MAG: hypothetical protein JWL98_159 [Xanthomonadaceae bacterium]|nr:hypothetical protein [Xanthomonadaceae bacterium]
MRRIAALLVLLVLSPVAMAWSALGHRLVGELAGRHVRPATQRTIAALLAGEPEPTLAGVADWADDLRYTDPARFKATSRWHFVNIAAADCRYEPQRDCPDGQCVIGAIVAQRAILADRNQTREARRDALKFLVHLVADAHQPLHAGGHGDKGGNRFQVSLRTDLPGQRYGRNGYDEGVAGTNLHAVWDYDVLASIGMGAIAYSNRLDAAPWPPVGVAGTSPAVWAGESCRLVDARALYPQGHTLDRRYLDVQRPLAELRIRQAGYRLAKLLDSALAH